MALVGVSLVLQKKVAGFFCLGVMVKWGKHRRKTRLLALLGLSLYVIYVEGAISRWWRNLYINEGHALGYFVCSFPEMWRLLSIILLVSYNN